MTQQGEDIKTGTVIGRYGDGHAQEIAVAVRLPVASWKAFSDGLVHALVNEGEVPSDADERLKLGIAILLDLTVMNWRDELGGPNG